MASMPLVIRRQSAIFVMSAFMKLAALIGRLSESRSLYFCANSRLRWVPTSPVAPVMRTFFTIPSR